MKNWLFLCTGNSCRSQMAEAWLRSLSGSQVVVESAGLEAHGLNPYAVKVMEEVGIAMSGHRSTVIDQVDLSSLDVLVTVCDHANESCPMVATEALRLHHSFTDPASAIGSVVSVLVEFRAVRDDIKAYCQTLVDTYQLS